MTRRGLALATAASLALLASCPGSRDAPMEPAPGAATASDEGASPAPGHPDGPEGTEAPEAPEPSDAAAPAPSFPAPEIASWALDKPARREAAWRVEPDAVLEAIEIAAALAGEDTWELRWAHILGGEPGARTMLLALRPAFDGYGSPDDWVLLLGRLRGDRMAVRHAHIPGAGFGAQQLRDVDGDGMDDVFMLREAALDDRHRDGMLLVVATGLHAILDLPFYRVAEGDGGCEVRERPLYACFAVLGDERVWLHVHADARDGAAEGCPEQPSRGFGLDVRRLTAEVGGPEPLWGVAVGPAYPRYEDGFEAWRRVTGSPHDPVLEPRRPESSVRACPGDAPALLVPIERLRRADGAPLEGAGFHLVIALGTTHEAVKARYGTLDNLGERSPAILVRLEPGTHFTERPAGPCCEPPGP